MANEAPGETNADKGSELRLAAQTDIPRAQGGGATGGEIERRAKLSTPRTLKGELSNDGRLHRRRVGKIQTPRAPDAATGEARAEAQSEGRKEELERAVARVVERRPTLPLAQL